jgi:hypothetical protein
MFSLTPLIRPTKTQTFRSIYLIAILFNYHALLVAFTNSTYMERFTSPTFVSMIFSLSAFVSIFLFVYFSRIIARLGNFPTLLFLGSGEILALGILATTPPVSIALLSFFVFLILNPVLYLCIDVFAETVAGNNESATGQQRGLLLTLMSLAAAAAPFTVAYLVAERADELYRVYLLATLCGLTFLLVTAYFFTSFKDDTYTHHTLKDTIKHIAHSRTLFPVFSAHFLLQIFFSWTTIYFPLYMITELGFSWGEVGAIIGVGLLAYVLFEYPVGIIADRWIGEKEMMFTGFVIIVTACAYVPFATELSVFGWAVLMFYSRIGAALVEATSEGYFFKHTTGKDSGYISMFRVLRPLSLSAGSLLGTLALLVLPFQYIFLALAGVLTLGTFAAGSLIDTR